MKILLLCGYREEGESAVGVKPIGDGGQTLIDHRIRQLRALNMDIICVVAGQSADWQLRNCPLIQDTELVFDTNDPVSLLSNTRAGLFAAPNEACFVLPVEVPPAPPEIWSFLRNEYGKAGFSTDYAILQATNPDQGAPWHYGFPLLLTFEGARLLLKTPVQNLLDPRFKYLCLPYSAPHDSGLAPTENPL